MVTELIAYVVALFVVIRTFVRLIFGEQLLDHLLGVGSICFRGLDQSCFSKCSRLCSILSRTVFLVRHVNRQNRGETAVPFDTCNDLSFDTILLSHVGSFSIVYRPCQCEGCLDTLCESTTTLLDADGKNIQTGTTINSTGPSKHR